MSAPEPGTTHTATRTFDEADVETVAAVLDGDGQASAPPGVVLYGLLTGSFLGDLGERLSIQPRRIESHFLRSVSPGDTLRCECRLDRVVEGPGGWDVTARVSIERVAAATEEPVTADGAGERGASVLEATVDGLVPDTETRSPG